MSSSLGELPHSLSHSLSGGHENAPPILTKLMQDAAAAHANPHRAESLLWSAQAMYPKALPVYFSLYKFYFHKRRLEEAEDVVRTALRTAAELAGFPPQWYCLKPTSCNWRDIFGPQHFYLFSLKALAFIRLRRGARNDCLAILEKLAEIDPDDSVGATVIRDIAAGAVEHSA